MTHGSRQSRSRWLSLACAFLGCTAVANAITVDVTSQDSIRSASETIAKKLWSYYNGYENGNEPGLLPGEGQPGGYYWWEGGAMFTAFIDYWYFTGDSQYNNLVTQAIMAQTGPLNDFEPPQQQLDLGNDDQSFWAFAAMTAAETKFPDPPKGDPSWLSLAIAVYNRQAARWDPLTCGGGMRWQFSQFNAGYTYKNSISNGCFMNVAARLGKYTGNSTYLDQAERTWDWMNAIGLITKDYTIWDGTAVEQNCTQQNNLLWSYQPGVLILATAAMWNATQNEKWKTALTGLIGGAKTFLPKDSIAVEIECEQTGGQPCSNDQITFKGYLIRWMAEASVIAPWSRTLIAPILAANTKAAAQACVCGPDGTTCGFSWTKGGCDGSTGVGQQMDALAAIQINLMNYTSGPVNESTGISVGDPQAGTAGANPNPADVPRAPITVADQAGAGILSAILVIWSFGGCAWLMLGT